jgi:hypothetical protein
MTLQNSFPFNGNTKLKEAALIYVAEGFSIIPLHWLSAKKCSCGKSDCASPAKHPLTPHGLKDASSDPAVVKDWWKKFPKANIGVCTGQASGGLTVIDFDLAKGCDPDSLIMPATLKIETGAGFHAWFRSTVEIRNSASKLGQGIDVRGWGGYVVAPPSIHHSGRTYKFLNENLIAEFPEELFKLLQPEPVPNPEADPPLILGYSPDMADFALEGSRNDFLTKIGGKLRRQGFSSTEIESALLASNQERCKPPLSSKEVCQIARSVGRYIPTLQIDSQIEEEPELILPDDRSPDPDSQPEQSTDQDADSSPNTPAREPLLGAMTLGELKMTIFGQPEMILQGLFRGDWGLVIGIGSVGKTAFLLNVCMCLASGRSFPPVIPEGQPPRRVLYLDFETPQWRLKEQAEILSGALTDKENALADQNFIFVTEPEIDGHPWRMTDVKSLQNLAAYIKKHKIDLVIIDTAAQAAALQDENSNGEVQRKIVVPIRRLAKHCNISILLVHHEGRGKTQNKTHDMQYRGRGATALPDASRYQITMVPFDPDKRGPVDIVNSKNKGHGFEKVVMTLDEQTRWFTQTLNPPARPAPKVEDLILDVLDSCTDPAGMTAAEISEMIPGVTQRTVERNLAKMVQDCAVEKAKRGLYRSVGPPPEKDPLSDDENNALTPP